MKFEFEMTKEELIELLNAQKYDFIINVLLEVEADDNAKENI